MRDDPIIGIDRYQAGRCQPQEHAIHRAIVALTAHDDRIESLALIRAAYGASLAEAEEILHSILDRVVRPS